MLSEIYLFYFGYLSSGHPVLFQDIFGVQSAVCCMEDAT
jgi:hypothetical protein